MICNLFCRFPSELVNLTCWQQAIDKAARRGTTID
jgi:hypothetical protein